MILRGKQNISVGTEMWVFRFERCSGKSYRIHCLKPSFGLITTPTKRLYIPNVKNQPEKIFVPYKLKNGMTTGKIGKPIGIDGLAYSDNYNEAASEFNRLVTEEMDTHILKCRALAKMIISI